MLAGMSLSIAIISGSHRPQAESLKVARYLQGWIEKNLKTAQSEIISLSDNPFPFWDEGMWNDDPEWKKIWGPTSQKLKKADAFVIISPEWSGMVPAGLKNFFLLCGQGELSHKPGFIVTVSAGMGGTYPVAELRMSSYKNTRICYIPEHVIVRKVGDVLNDAEKTSSNEDEYLRKRLAYGLNLLMEYGEALKKVRESGVINAKEFPNGM